MAKCFSCKTEIMEGFFRCSQCQKAFDEGVDLGDRTARNEVAYTLRKWIEGR